MVTETADIGVVTVSHTNSSLCTVRYKDSSTTGTMVPLAHCNGMWCDVAFGVNTWFEGILMVNMGTLLPDTTGGYGCQ